MNAYQDSGPSLSHLLRVDHRDGRHDVYPDARCPICAADHVTATGCALTRDDFDTDDPCPDGGKPEDHPWPS